MVFSCPIGVRWLRDHDRILLVNVADGGESVLLEGIDAAIWDLVAQGLSAARVLQALDVFSEVPRGEEEARSILVAVLDRLVEQGMLVKKA